MYKKPAVVVLSGGQDSATCLALALSRDHSAVHTITFDYGQRHAVEIDCAVDLARRWNVPNQVVPLYQLRDLVTSALLTTGEDVGASHARLTNLPASFVPARNALFITLAHGLAQEVGAGHIYLGVCETDFSGYPDCRQAFIVAMESALNVGYQASIKIETPLMYRTKAETFKLARDLDVLPDIIDGTHTCYNGDREHVHAWGRGCGECPACLLRAKGYNEYLDRLEA